MSLSTPPIDNSESNQDQLRFSSLIQPQYTYHRFLASLFEYSRAAYDFTQLPTSGIGYANEISALSTVFPLKTEDPSSPVLTVGEQDAVGPDKDTQSPSTPDAPSSSTPASHAHMFRNSRDTRIGDNATLVNIANRIQCGDNSLLIILVIVASICLRILLLIPGVYHPSQSAFADPSNKVSLDFPPGVDTIHALGRLEQFVSQGAINGSDVQDPTRQVHPGTRERVLGQIKAWIDNPNTTHRILWLHGPAGVGKSTIAQTITRSYTNKQIPANFFFFHSDSERNDGKRLFTTLAWQFTISIPAIKRHIARSLIEQPDLLRKDVETQFQELIVRPFEALRNDTPPPQLSDMVVVIDGRLQEWFLNVIGNVVTDIRVPLRFLIISRPEDHIKKTIDRFQRPTLFIDLAEYADADRDIEVYLKDKFDEIAKDQDLDPAIWPGEEIIQKLVHKASGQFIYASTVIRFVDDEDNGAEHQLDIILGLQPPTTTHPFAALDGVYIKILERQVDQSFLKTFLALLVAQYESTMMDSSATMRVLPDIYPLDPHFTYTCEFLSPFRFCSYSNLSSSYGILMNIPEPKLQRRLRKMRSLLKFTPGHIGVHHRSFIEFLCDPSRSGHYNISTENAMKQHFDLVVASITRAAEQVIDQPNRHPPLHFDAVGLVKSHPRYRDTLSKEDLREASFPLLKFQDRLLDLPNIVPRNECTVFHVVNTFIDHFLHRKNAKPQIIGTIDDLRITLLSVRPEAAAMKVHSWSEAQNLMDLIDRVIDGFPTGLAQKAVQLAFEIHARIPVLPQSIKLAKYVSSPYNVLLNSCELEAYSQVLLMGHFLDDRYILAVSNIYGQLSYINDFLSIAGYRKEHESPIHGWRKNTNPGYKEIMFIVVNLARAIQYLHSMGFALSDRIGLDDIVRSPYTGVKISPEELVWLGHSHSLQEVSRRYEIGIYMFGSVFCMMYLGTSESSCTTSWATRTSLYKPESTIPGDMGQLIQRCLSAEDKPTIDEVVQEMESWKLCHSFNHPYPVPFCVI